MTTTAGVRAVFVSLVLAASVAPAAVPVANAAVDGATAALAPETVDPDTVRILVSVREDGTAEWRVEYRVELDGENRTDAFESFEADVENDTGAYEAEFRELMQPSVDQAANATGREMALRNVSVSTSREVAPPTGVVVYELEWTAFAARDGGRLLVGDAISGFYVSEETILRIEWPDGYRAADVSPMPDERSERGVEWHGRTAFGSAEPRVTVAPSGGGGEAPVPLSLAAAAAVAVVATLGLVGRAHSGTDDGSRSGGSAADPAEGEVNADDASAADSGRSSGSRSGPDDGGAAAADADATVGAPPDELLSNEERVVAALENHGGRMKQQELAERLDWGAPKTSRVVGSLREDDAVEVFRLGRENVVTLPEEDLLS